MKNTDTNEKILELFFNFPLRKFYVREISRLLKISAPSVSSALKNLEKKELITLKRGIVHEASANLENQEFKYLKRVNNLKSIYSSGLFEYLYGKFSLNIIILFGSYSRGEDNEKSDIDIAIDSKEIKLDLEGYEKILNRKINIEFIDFKKINKELKESIINGIVLSGYIR